MKLTLPVGRSSATVRVVRREPLTYVPGDDATLCVLETVWDREPTYAVAYHAPPNWMGYWDHRGQLIAAYHWTGMSMRQSLRWTTRAEADAEFERRLINRGSGEWFRAWYERRGWDQTRVAAELGIPQPRVSEMATGKAPVRAQTVKLILALDRIAELES